MVPWFLILFCTFVIIFQTRLKYNDRNRTTEKDMNDFIAYNVSANFSRLRPLDDNMYVYIDKEALPFGVSKEEEALEIEREIKERLKAPLISTGIDSSTELIERFGRKNLEMIVEGEENLTYLIAALNNWAKLLIMEHNVKDAERVLFSAVNVGSDISETFILLYEIYETENNTHKKAALMNLIDKLPETAKNRAINAITFKEKL